MEVKLGKTNRSNDTFSDDEILDDTYHTNGTRSSDAEEEEDDLYGTEHEDL